MIRFLSLIFVISIASLSVAQNPKTDSSSKDIILEYVQYNETSGRHRAPLRLNIQAYYNAESNTIDIAYDGEAEGEVYIYLNENIIGYDSEINTSIQLPTTSGLYKIYIIEKNWIARGQIQL